MRKLTVLDYKQSAKQVAVMTVKFQENWVDKLLFVKNKGFRVIGSRKNWVYCDKKDLIGPDVKNRLFELQQKEIWERLSAR